MNRERKDILWRVYLLYFGLLLFSIAIIGKAAVIQIKEGSELLAKAKEQELRYFNIEANRGNILSDNGSLLATTIPVFEIRMDVASTNISDELFNEKKDSLAAGLSRILGDRSPYQYKKDLSRARLANNRYYLIKRRVTYEKLKDIRHLPIFRLGRYKGGLIVISKKERELPYRDLAKRTIGYANIQENIKVGLEGAYTDILKGIEGKQLRRRISDGEWKPVGDGNDIEPKNGMDIITTIDVNLQDVAEHALLEHLKEHQATQGCVVLMEVSTGAVKAIANLLYDSTIRKYKESYNYAIGASIEPGSTFKLASMIAAMEKGKIDLNDTVDTGDGWIVYSGYTMKDVHKIRDGRISYREAFEHSSNVGISKICKAIFDDNPAEFVDILYSMSLNQPLGIEIPGEGIPNIKHPDSDNTYWAATDLAWMSIGYTIQLTPLQVLTFYNAIANDGEMVKPRFIREINYAGRTIETVETEVINPEICSAETIDSVKSLLEGVIQRGTAKILRNPHYTIAGKTGTAKIAMGRHGYTERIYNASFVGYFPSDNPQYSCIVVVNKPQSGKIYGGTVAAPVFKEIADKIYATSMDISPMDIDPAIEGISHSIDVKGRKSVIDLLLAELDYQNNGNAYGEEVWARVHAGKSEYSKSPMILKKNIVPDVKGLSSRDAVFLLEKHGLTPKIQGSGWVQKQSLPNGAHFTTGDIITLYLSRSR